VVGTKSYDTGRVADPSGTEQLFVSLQNCMNEEYWRLAGPDLPDSPDGGNGIQFAFRYNELWSEFGDGMTG
jgi:hypothetical protein